MAELLNMPKDVIHAIMLLLVSSFNGAQDFARALSVCKLFYGFADDQKLEEAMVFDNVSITDKFRAVLRSNDLLFRCAKVGNASAQHLLAKVLVMSSSLLFKRERSQLPDIRHGPDPTKAENDDEDDDVFSAAGFVVKVKEDGLNHAKLVQSFLRRSTPREIVELGDDLINYVNYFTVGDTFHHDRFARRVKAMIMFGNDIVAGAQVNLMEILKMITAKQRALSEQGDSRKKTRGALYSYSIAEDLRKEISFLQTKVIRIIHLCLVHPDCGYGEDENPAIYFEKCRLGALEDFAMFFTELK